MERAFNYAWMQAGFSLENAGQQPGDVLRVRCRPCTLYYGILGPFHARTQGCAGCMGFTALAEAHWRHFGAFHLGFSRHISGVCNFQCAVAFHSLVYHTMQGHLTQIVGPQHCL